MKTTKTSIAILCLLAAFNTYADTTDNKQPQQPAQSQSKEEKSQSLYDSIKSGWNSMLDAMMGPATPDESNKQ